VVIATESVDNTVSSAERLNTAAAVMVSVVAIVSSSVREKTPRIWTDIVSVDNTVSSRVLANIVAVVMVSVDTTVSSMILNS